MNDPEVDVVVVGHRPGAETERVLADAVPLAGLAAKLRYFDNTGNPKNLSRAWNDLAREGRAPYIAFLNSDAVPCPGWAARLSAVLSVDSGAGAVFPQPLLPPKVRFLDREFSLSEPPTRAEMRALAAWASEKHPDLSPHKAHAKAGLFSVMMRRTDFEALSGFDERLRFYGQDHDIQERLAERGLSTVRALACPFYPGRGAATRKAIDLKDIDINAEYEHCGKTLAALRSGKLNRWHLLSDAERAAVRKDPACRISKGR